MPDDLDDSVREQAIEKLKNSNSEISATEELNDNYHIGPYYLMVNVFGKKYINKLIREIFYHLKNKSGIDSITIIFKKQQFFQNWTNLS